MQTRRSTEESDLWLEQSSRPKPGLQLTVRNLKMTYAGPLLWTPVFHYDRVQRAFHWSMAAIILAAIALGIWAFNLERGSELKASLLYIHKSLGLTVLILVMARLPYRLAIGKPPYRQSLHTFNRIGSSAAHLLLYALMILMPISGYVFTGAAGRPLPFFGLFEWPSLVPKDKVLSQLAGVFHYWGAWIICSVLALHVLAVAWHSWVKKDGVSARMLP
jgi:cytochrome b561